MKDFEMLLALAVQSKGGREMVDSLLPPVASPNELLVIPDDRFLSTMARCIFRAGFVWKVIDNKWPHFEEAFSGFNPLVVAHYSDEKLEVLAQDTRIVRNATKIKAVRDNAAFVLDVQQSHGSMANLIAQWPEHDIVGLWAFLKKSGTRLGGNTGPMILRMMGKDTFLLSKDVTTAIVQHGFMEKFSPNSQRDLSRVQEIFNLLQQQSGWPLSHLSRMLACTV